jgi:hypothetical protein
MNRVFFSAPLEELNRNRLTAFFRILLAIPWAIVAMFYGLAAAFAAIAAWFAIVFTGAYPQGLYDFNAGFLRFHGRVTGWLYLLTDEWPPFGGDPDTPYPVRVQVGPPKAEYSRAKAFFRIFWGIPVIVITYIIQTLVGVLGLVVWAWMVISGTLPEGLYRLLRNSLSYQVKAAGFWLLLTEDFPEIWLDEGEEVAKLEAGAQDPDALSPPPATA